MRPAFLDDTRVKADFVFVVCSFSLSLSLFLSFFPKLESHDVSFDPDISTELIDFDRFMERFENLDLEKG